MKPKYYANLSQKDKKKQIAMIEKSKRLYKKGQYFTRKKLNYPVKVSPHIIRAQKLYDEKIHNLFHSDFQEKIYLSYL